MITLSRTLRFAINPDAPPPPGVRDPNGYGGVPAMRGLGRHYELEVVCKGDPSPATGYLINIKEIDLAARAEAIPRIAAACADRPAAEPGPILAEIIPPLNDRLAGRVHSVRWWLTPYYSVEMNAQALGTVLVRQKFDFCASHRLHMPNLSDEENRRCFGRCNHPSGHGHNYQVEPCVAVPVELSAAGRFTLPDLERIADAVIVERFDHKHLNKDTAEFGPQGVNPSVELIAKVCFDLLAAALRQEFPDVALRTVTVWETDRTCATYPA